MVRQRPAESVSAWDLREGDQLPDEVIVLSVHREPRSRTVRIMTSERVTGELPADGPVTVIRRVR